MLAWLAPSRQPKCASARLVSNAVTDVAALSAASAPLPNAARRRAWGPEFWATGGATLVLLPLCWLLERGLGLERAELAVGFLAFHAAHLINDPHFAVTYLLFYRGLGHRLRSRQVPLAQRLRYLGAGLVAPLLLVAWAAHALVTGSSRSLGLMTQLMFLLVGWHYVKQGFGVATVLSARQGIGYGAWERRAILAHCFAGWAYAWSSPFDPGRLVEEKGVVYATLPHPGWLEPLSFGVFVSSAVLLAAVLGLKWRRERALPLAPLGGMLVTVWLWVVYSGIDPLFMYLIPALHSVQYLYFVYLLKRNQARTREGPPEFGRPPGVVLGAWLAGSIALGLLLFHFLPGALDAALVDRRAARSSELGATPYFAALFVIVNVHHYFMDAALWRRENPDTHYLRVA
jgi:hypothetical protein